MPYYDDKYFKGKGQRAARDPETGKSVLVDDMSYTEWKEKYVKDKGQATWDYKEKLAKNKTADREQYQKFITVLGKEAPKSLEEFQEIKYNDSEGWRFIKLDYGRQNELIRHPELKLPNAENAIADDRKFSEYLFNPNNTDGWAKGQAFLSRLGYNVDNYQELQKAIIDKAKKYPATFKGNIGYGDRYEQKIVLYGKNNKPANVIVGWLVTENNVKMTTVYIKEV